MVPLGTALLKDMAGADAAGPKRDHHMLCRENIHQVLPQQILSLAPGPYPNFGFMPILCFLRGQCSGRTLQPPHSTTVKPSRSGCASFCAGSSTGSSNGCQAIKTRISVSGVGVMCRRARFV